MLTRISVDHVSRVRPIAVLGVALAACLFASAGCSSMNPGAHDSFDSWLVGDPHGDYVIDPRAEDRPQIYRMFYGALFTPPLLVRDLARLAAVPGVDAYFAVRQLQE